MFGHFQMISCFFYARNINILFYQKVAYYKKNNTQLYIKYTYSIDNKVRVSFYKL